MSKNRPFCPHQYLKCRQYARLNGLNSVDGDWQEIAIIADYLPLWLFILRLPHWFNNLYNSSEILTY